METSCIPITDLSSVKIFQHDLGFNRRSVVWLSENDNFDICTNLSQIGNVYFIYQPRIMWKLTF